MILQISKLYEFYLVVSHFRTIKGSNSCLQVRLVLDQLLGPAVQEADVGVGADHVLPVQLQHHSEMMLGLKREVFKAMVSVSFVTNYLEMRTFYEDEFPFMRNLVPQDSAGLSFRIILHQPTLTPRGLPGAAAQS